MVSRLMSGFLTPPPLPLTFRRRWLLLAAMLTLASCATADRSDQIARQLQPDPSMSAEENLQRLAGREQLIPDLQPLPVAVPPGIEPGTLSPRASNDDRAFLSLSEAVRSLVRSHRPDQAGATQRPSHDEPAPPDDEDLDLATAATRHFVKGRQAMLEERYYIAITEFQRAAEHDPTSPRIRRELARAYLAINNQSRAMEQFAILRALDPDDAEAVFALGLNAATQREYELSVAMLGERLLKESGDGGFHHDPAANLLARYVVAFSLRHLGYDRAFIEVLHMPDAPRDGHQAAHSPFDIPSHLFEQTRYASRLGSVYRQRSELWRSVGDAHCRLGNFASALDAYAISAALPAPDPAALHPRVIYANLRLGRANTAQYELLAALKRNQSQISDRDVRLCQYLADSVGNTRLLAEAVRDMYRESPDDSALARAAAALLEPQAGRVVLREFVERRPRDLNAVSSLLTWVAGRDPRTAAALTIDLVEANPDLADQYVNRLVFSVPDPSDLAAAWREGAGSFENDGDAIGMSRISPASSNVRARLLAALGALGEAWRVADRAWSRWPDNEPLLNLRLELAALLEEPALLDSVLREAAPFDSAWSWITRARALRRMNQHEQAMNAAEEAVAIAERRGSERGDRRSTLLQQALIEQARTYAAYAEWLADSESRSRWAEEALIVAERVLAHDASDDGARLARDAAYEVILTLHGPSGLMPDIARAQRAAQRLRDDDSESRLYARVSAENAILQGRFDQALEQLLNLYDSHPHDTRSLELAVTAWSRLDRLDAARQWLSDRLTGSGMTGGASAGPRPGDPALLEQWVKVCLMQDRAAEAIGALQNTMERNPEHVTARRLLESVYRAAGRADLAFPLGEQRLLARPLGVRREVELAALYAGAGMEREALDRIEWIVEQLHRDEEHAAASDRFSASPAMVEHVITAIAVLGRIEPTDRRHDELTIALVKHAVFPSTGAGQPAALPLQVYGAGLRSLARQDGVDDPLFEELAEHAAWHAIGAGPTVEHALHWRGLAQALLDHGHPAAAAAALRARVFSDAPLNDDAFGFLANLVIVCDAAAHGGEAQAEESIAFLARLVERGRPPMLPGLDGAPALVDLLDRASVIYAVVGDEPGNMRILEAILEHHDGHDADAELAMTFNNLAYLRIERGRSDASTAQMAERAFNLMQDDPNILDTIGWLRYKQGDFAGAEDRPGALGLLRRAAEQADEPSAEIHDHLGDVYWRLGESERAVEQWRAAEEILADPARREAIVRNYILLQRRGWGLVVADAETMYDRDYGNRLTEVRAKLRAVVAGETPPVAPTFAELKESLEE